MSVFERVALVPPVVHVAVEAAESFSELRHIAHGELDEVVRRHIRTLRWRFRSTQTLQKPKK